MVQSHIYVCTYIQVYYDDYNTDDYTTGTIDWVKVNIFEK